MKKMSIIAIALLLMAIGAVTVEPTETTEDATDRIVAAALDVLDRPLSIGCIGCGSCSSGHVTSSPPMGEWGGGLHNDSCLAGSCLFVHGVCGGLLEEGEQPSEPVEFDTKLMTSLGDAIASGDGAALAAVISTNRDLVRYNAARRAIQLIGCSDQIVAHIPVPHQQATEVERAIGVI